ncbi:PREDICTED: LOW QUALITY PROTEIN: tyrosine-protein phosphatase non-receptor type 23, partial [Gekko japonicus]|uniref:LOW QUALITY PROTEIN: tyrosine-protein phosphatase non-receptor type 23 n=1 Tax=Gekko japonicus TaxID=146911 RepID=A0ABM1JP17_GEKJA
QFMDSLQLDPETVDNLDMYNHIPPVLMEKCAALSVRPETVKNLVQSMQVLSGVFTDVEASLKEIRDLLDEDEAQEQKLRETLGKLPPQQGSPPATASSALAEVAKEWAKYMEVHEKASFTNAELHKAMNLHISNLRLLSGPLEQVRAALPTPSLTEEDKQVMQNLKRILAKVQEMKDQRVSLEQQLREMIQKDDITTSLVTTGRSEMKKLFEEQLKKYDQIKVYLEQNLAAQENILKALTDANVKYATVRKALAEVEHKWNTTLQTLVTSYEAYEDLMKKSQEGKDFYADLEGKVGKLLEKAQAGRQAAEDTRQQVLEREMKKRPPPRPTTPKPPLQAKAPDLDPAEPLPLSSLSLADLPEELRSLPPEVLASHLAQLPPDALAALLGAHPSGCGGLRAPGPEAFRMGGRATSAPLQPPQVGQPAAPYPPGQYMPAGPLPRHYLPARGAAPTAGIPAGPGQGPFPGALGTPHMPTPQMQPSAPQPAVPPLSSAPSSSQAFPPGAHLQGPALASLPPAYPGPQLPPPRSSPQHLPMPISTPGPAYCRGQPASSGGALPAGHAPPLSVRPPPTAPHPFGDGGFPAHTQAVRPATTTVDSIQAPISSCTFPRGTAGPLPPWAGPPPQGGFVGQQRPSLPFPYAQARAPPYMQQALPPFSVAQPPQGFSAHGPLQPPLERPVQPRALAGQPSLQQFLPQGQLPLQPPAFQSPFPPQVSGQQPFPGQGPAHPPSQGQFPGQPGPQHYQLPPHSGALAFPGISAGMMGPPPPHRPSLAAVQPFPPGSSGQVAFGSAPSPRPPGPPATTQIPPGAPRALAGPQPPPASQPVPRHIPPAPSPAGPQMPGGVVVPGVALPSPAPSPQPSMAAPPPILLPSSVPCPGPLPPLPPSSLAPGAAPLLQGPAEVQFHRQSSSTDDLLSSSPESQLGCAKAAVSQPLLQPTKADAKDGLKPKAVQLIEKDPYEKPERIRRLLAELERFRDTVAGLEKPAPAGGVSELDAVWKELQDAQEKDARQLSIAIARCYSMKNRHQDIMPYDKNRIVLQSGKDDYINASRVEDLSSYCPTIIATQAPLPGTAADFWLMIYEQKVSVVVMLVSEQEIEKQKVVRYFPTERGHPMVHGPLTLVLTSLKATPTHVERMITLQFRDQSLKRTVIHLQFSSWPELGLPDSKGDLLRFIQEVHSHYLHQRPLHTPIVVHCSSGVGRTGAFCLLYAAMQEVEAGNSIPDLAQLVKRIRRQRKHMLQEKLHLKFCYESVLKHAKQVLQRHGVTAPSSSKPASSPSQKLYVHQDPQDLPEPPSAPAVENNAAVLQPPPAAPPPPHPADDDDGRSGSLEQAPPLSPPAPGPQPTVENSHRVEDGGEEERESMKPLPLPEAPAVPVAPPSSSSSLELLASLTPEAFTLDNALKGRHRMSKQSFLQPQNGEGLRGTRPSGGDDDDPLSLLDPLWTLNKT